MYRIPVRRRVVAAAALAATALALTVVPATAGAARGPHISASAPAGMRPNVASNYLAGYQVTEPGIWHASTQFHVPAMTCTADTAGTGAGIGNEQTEGVPTLLTIVFLACVGGAPQYSLMSQAGGDTQFGTSSAGDLLVMSITQTTRQVTAVIRNKTAGTVLTATGTPTPDNTMLFGLFPLFSGSRLPVADFGVLQMPRSYVENTTLRDWSPTKVNRSVPGTLEVSTSNFAPSGGFKLTYVAP